MPTFRPYPVNRQEEPNFYDMVAQPLNRGIEGYMKIRDQQRDADYRKFTMDMARAKEAREAGEYAQKFGTPMPATLTDQGPGGLTFDQGMRTTLRPDMARFAMGQANAPMAGLSPQLGPQPPQSAGLVDAFRNWQRTRREPDYSGIGLNSDDVTAAIGDTSGFSDIGENRRESLLKYAKEKRDQRLSDARTGYYGRSRTGSGGRGAGFQGATYANLVAQRNQLIRQKEYAIPGSDEERDALSMIDDIDQELLTRRGKPTASAPTGGHTPPSQGDDAVIAWLKQKYKLQNPTPKDIQWARGRMSGPAR